MSSVSSTDSSSYTSLSSSIRGYGGLASGLDRDTLIEQMTYSTRAKIAAQKQKQTKLEWQQEAIREITSKIYNFTNSFTSYTSSTNLLSTTLFSRNKVSAVGENSGCIAVSGTATSSENLSITRIKQLASNTTMTTNNVSNKQVQTAAIDLGTDGTLSQKREVSTIAGDSLYIKYGTTQYTVTLKDTDAYDYSSPQSAAEAINQQLANVTIGSGTSTKTLADVMRIECDGSNFTFRLNSAGSADGNTVQLAGATGSLLYDLGFLDSGETFSSLEDEDKIITASGLTGGYGCSHITEEKTVAQCLSGAEISFTYNGDTQWITLDSYSSSSTLEDVQKDLQKKLNSTFGNGRITVAVETATDENTGKTTGTLSFKTTDPNTGNEDPSSTFSIDSGTGLLGESGLFGIAAGSSNRVNLNATLTSAGLANGDQFRQLADSNGNYSLVINGIEVEGITTDSTISEIISKINNTEGIGVTVAYQSMADRFIITSTENGASGKIDFDFVSYGGSESINLARYLFGDTSTEDAGEAAEGIPESTYKAGQDAIFSIQYPGGGDEVEISRASNTFSLDGINITLKKTFGWETVTDEDTGEATLQKVEDAEAITFDAQVDADATVEAVKSMVDAFNEILDLVNTECKTKPDRDYEPLTDEQKEEMTESEIEKWEAKAKEGILFADTDLRLMADKLRSVIISGDRSALSDIGITTSTDYSDNGKLVFDETAFRTALQSDPDSVKNLFTRAASTDEDGNAVQGGLMVRIKSIMDQYGSMTGSTKGILVERAGSIYAPTTVLSNSIQSSIDDIDDVIERLQDKLETETDRYISQFTTLETLISEMNSQSSYISSMFG